MKTIRNIEAFTPYWEETPTVLNVPDWYIEDLKKFEGFSPVAYKPKGESNYVTKLTIGYGHYGAYHGDKISEKEAHDLLISDLDRVEQELQEAYPGASVHLSVDRYVALVDFIFNIGITKFKRSSLYKRLIANPNDSMIFWEFGRWIFSGGKRLPGLVKRCDYRQKLWKRNSNDSNN